MTWEGLLQIVAAVGVAVVLVWIFSRAGGGS
jgi:hypothetical protein